MGRPVCQIVEGIGYGRVGCRVGRRKRRLHGRVQLGYGVVGVCHRQIVVAVVQVESQRPEVTHGLLKAACKFHLLRIVAERQYGVNGVYNVVCGDLHLGWIGHPVISIPDIVQRAVH